MRGCERTSDAVVADTSPSGVLGLGDYQYDCGDPSDYAVSYNPTWGRVDSLMEPVAGNHEYKTGTDAFGAASPTTNTTAQNYFSHFGPATFGYLRLTLHATGWTSEFIDAKGSILDTANGTCHP